MRGRLSEELAGLELLSGPGPRRAPKPTEVCAPRLVKAVAIRAYVKEAKKTTFCVCGGGGGKAMAARPAPVGTQCGL